jgi:hypothetical protein
LEKPGKVQEWRELKRRGKLKGWGRLEESHERKGRAYWKALKDESHNGREVGGKGGREEGGEWTKEGFRFGSGGIVFIELTSKSRHCKRLK